MLNSDTIKEIRERYDNSTKGFWDVDLGGLIIKSSVETVEIGHNVYMKKSDVDFILNARKDIPLLLNGIEVLDKRFSSALDLISELKLKIADLEATHAETEEHTNDLLDDEHSLRLQCEEKLDALRDKHDALRDKHLAMEQAIKLHSQSAQNFPDALQVMACFSCAVADECENGAVKCNTDFSGWIFGPDLFPEDKRWNDRSY